MENNKENIVSLIVLLFTFLGLTEASVCYVSDGMFGYSFYEYCAFGCCGYGSYKYCCAATWPVIGIVVGCGVMISIIVTIVCCCRKSRGNRGMVCQTNPRTTTTVVTAGTVQSAYPAQTTVTTYPVQPTYPAYQAGYQQVYQPQGYPQYPQTAQAGMVGSSSTSYTGLPDTKPMASAPPMEPPPPYPQ